MKVLFKHYEDSDYLKVIDFLIDINKDGNDYINWNWARFEWMMDHPEFNNCLKSHIGLWIDQDKVVGLAIYDMYLGEGFCGWKDEYNYLADEVLNYAYFNLKDENGLAIAINDNLPKLINEVTTLGFKQTSQKEIILKKSLEETLEYALHEDISICEIGQDEDNYALSWLFWQGFDHGNDIDEFNKEYIEVIPNRPHFNKSLSLVAKDKDNQMVGICCLWYLEHTDYAYLEPLCIIPSFRGKGIGKALVNEACKRVKQMGAKEVYVISDLDFYKHLGFKNDQSFTFYLKK